MDLKNYTILGLLLSLCVGFFIAKSMYQKPPQIKEVYKDRIHKIIIHERNKDGSSKTTTEIIKDTTRLKQEIYQVSNRVTISGLVATDLSQSIPKPIYGAHVSKEFIGPISIGAFGLTNGIIGLSIGLSF